MTDAEWVEISERLGRRIVDLGLTLEQVGPDGAAEFEFGEEGEILVFLGDEERICENVDEAVETLEDWADELGADPARAGAIVEFVERLVERLEGVAPTARLQAFFDQDLPPLLERYGLHEIDPDAFDPDVDDESVLCLIEDGNGACWVVFLDEDDEVSYDVAEAGGEVTQP
jgi:hypothetical protein